MITEPIEINYGASRPLRFEPYVLDSYEREGFLTVIYEHVYRSFVMSTVVKLDESRLCRLIEKATIEICREHAPMRNFGIKMAEIRAAILALIDGYKAGANDGGDGNR